ncbi:MAG TPA: SLBB domain-containing protein [Terracidiphilus sp.]|nr:SLBB domain-containing protein [Terracidiphilus sp.]
MALFTAAHLLPFFAIFCLDANSQVPSASAPAQSAAQFAAGQSGSTASTANDEDRASGETRDSQTGSGSVAPITALSSSQIINILEQNPDLSIALKSQLADRMHQQGVEIDPNDISDQALYRQISTSRSLRANITTGLRDRGIVSDDEIRSLGSGVGGDGTLNEFPLAQRSTSTDDGAALIGPGSASSIGEGMPGIDVNGAPETFPLSTRPDRTEQSPRESPRGLERANASTDAPKVVHQPTPFDFQSMHDLYSQIPDETPRLERFGSDVFVNRVFSATARGISGRDTPLDVPLGPDYIVGAGDKLTIDLWGTVTQTITGTVDRDGRIFLPEAGVVQVAGLSLGKVQSLIEGVLRPQFRNAQVAVTVSGLRSVRVYVVGDVQRPGGYDISSLATPLSAFYAAGGPTAVGSLRMLQHYRRQMLIEEVDLYDFLLHGVRKGSAPFESGDTLLVPPAGPQIAIFGAVKRQAIYELKSGETSLAVVIDAAGGFTAAASLPHIKIERIDANQQRETVSLPSSNPQNPATERDVISAFQVKDGDRITVEPILPYSQRAIYLVGHVARPGRMAYAEGMRLSDVIHSYQDLLPEPAAHGEIVRLVPPDLHAETIDFNVPDLLIGNANIGLQPFDTIHVFGRYQVDAPVVTIRGEVMHPGEYPMFRGMTSAQLVRMAGGFKRDALQESADLTSYEVDNGRQVAEKLTTIKIGAAVAGTSPGEDVSLKPGDILAIHQITNWGDIGESITISGQVRYPGSYGFYDGEHLSSVLRRAGGLLPTAYPLGAVLARAQVRGLEQSSRDELVRQIEANSAAARLSPGASGSNSAAALQLIKSQQDQVLADLQSHPPTGRMVIHISADIESWANTPADIELRPGDELTIPKQPGFVLVTGQVYNATALTFTPGKTAGWYLSHAGGTNVSANRKEIFIIRANGSVVGHHSGGAFNSDVLSTRLNPGDVVVVPQKIIGGSMFWRNLLITGQLAASVAVSAGVASAAL